MSEKIEKKTSPVEIPITWRSIPIKITYHAQFLQTVLKTMGYQLALVEVHAQEPLPLTETGYRSIFLPNSVVEEIGGVVAYVNNVLDEEAKSKKWQKHAQQKNQLKLF